LLFFAAKPTGRMRECTLSRMKTSPVFKALITTQGLKLALPELQKEMSILREAKLWRAMFVAKAMVFQEAPGFVI
jgi:hypothetical protein